MAESDDTVAKKIKNKRRNIQKTTELHARKTKERTEEAQQIKAYYQADKNSPVVRDLLVKAKKFQEYHIKLAQDGQGARSIGLDPTTREPILEPYALGPNERCSNLDKAAGIQELIDYVDRQIADELPKTEEAAPQPEETENADDSQQ